MQIRHYATLEYIYFPVNTIFIHFMFLKILQKWKCFPYSYKIWGKKSFFCLNFRINNYFKLNWVRFYIRCIKYNTCIKTNTKKLSWKEFSCEKMWKIGNFQFCRFSPENTYISIFLVNCWNYHLYSGWCLYLRTNAMWKG